MCTFCKIVRGKLPCYEVYKNKEVTAFLDINPIAPGHTLVVPNKHVEKLDHLEDSSVRGALMQALVDVSNQLINAGLCEDYTILSDNGLHADQDELHLHFHIIPRLIDEEIKIYTPTNQEAAKETELLHVLEVLQRSK